MKILVNKEELKKEWVLNKWYEKTLYVLGTAIITLWLTVFVVAFIVGVASGV